MERNKKEKIVNVLGYDGLKIVQRDDVLNFSLDFTLLADFVTINASDKKIIDLGCGNGYIPIFLTLRTKANIVGVEIQQEVYELAKKSISLNNLEEQIKVLNMDINDLPLYYNPSTFDVVVSNPPYFQYTPESIIKKSIYQTIARHEVKINLKEIIKTANYLLKDGGTFSMVHRSERFLEIINLLNEYHFEPKRIKFVYAKKSSKESVAILIESKKNGKPGGLKILNPIYVTDDNNEYTEEILKIFNFKKE